MFKSYDNCIFCFRELVDYPTGFGEHVIPKNLYGSWHIHDICPVCREYFGNNIDQLGRTNVELQNAIFRLNLPDAEKLAEHLPYVGRDPHQRCDINMRYKNGAFKSKARKVDQDFLECSEDDLENFGLKWLVECVRDKIPAEVREREFERILERYEALQPGETVHSKALGYSMRKCTVGDIKVDEASVPPITPLIAKIAVCFLLQVLNPEQIYLLSEIDNLVGHARFGVELNPNLIQWCAQRSERECRKCHLLRVGTERGVLIVDISLFGYPNWRIVLRTDESIFLADHKGNAAKSTFLALDFENLEERRKFVGHTGRDGERLETYLLKA